jgi:hypothetical protein
MALDRDEFLRSLQPLLQGCEWDSDGNRVRVGTPDGDVCIALQPTGYRSLGSLRLPETLVELDLGALSDEAAADFLARFERAFQRGGG